MARPIALRQAQPVPDIKIEDGLAYKPKTLWSPPRGLDYLNRKSRIDDAHSPEIMNFLLDRGVLRTRRGGAALGAAAGVPIMAVVNFITGAGIGFLIRFLTTKLQRWDGAAWVDIGGAFTGGTSDFWAYTAFNDTLIFSNNVNGLWEYAPLTGLFQQIAAGPNARHLSTIGGRVIASAARGQEGDVEWSAKNNSHGWGIAFEGAGVEPLRSTPGGQIDQVIGVWPISETVSLMVRSNSVWQVTQSGDETAPFRFEQRYAKMGSRSRFSIDVVPGGLVELGTDDIYVLDDTQPTPIGQLIKDRIFQTVDLTKAKGLYRPRLRQYWLTLGGDEVYVYSFQDQGWTRLKYPFNVRWFEESIFSYGGITWDSMVGTWDTHPETWDSLLGVANQPGLYFATDAASGVIVAEDLTTETDSHIQAGKVAIGIEIQTPELSASTPLDLVQVNEAWCEYEAAAGQTLTFEYSADGGVTWTLYSTKVIAVTTKVKLLKPEKSIERSTLMLRIRSDTIGKLTLVSFSPMLLKGGERAS